MNENDLLRLLGSVVYYTHSKNSDSFFAGESQAAILTKINDTDSLIAELTLLYEDDTPIVKIYQNDDDITESRAVVLALNELPFWSLESRVISNAPFSNIPRSEHWSLQKKQDNIT